MPIAFLHTHIIQSTPFEDLLPHNPKGLLAVPVLTFPGVTPGLLAILVPPPPVVNPSGLPLVVARDPGAPV